MTKPSDLATSPCKAITQPDRSLPQERNNKPVLNPHLQNPELPGGEFFWPGGSTGILLCHGFTATTAEVRPLARCLNDAGYTVAGPLLPGHNTSPDDLNRTSWTDWVKAYARMLDRLYACCDQVILGGESTGALLGLYRAATDPRPAAILAYAPALKLSLKPDTVLLLRLVAPFKASWSKGQIQNGTPWQGYRVNPLKGVLELIKLQKATLPLLAKINQPVLIVQGRLDATVHPGVPETIAARVSSTIKEIHWMENSPHTVIVSGEQAEVARITLDFLRRVELSS